MLCPSNKSDGNKTAGVASAAASGLCPSNKSDGNKTSNIFYHSNYLSGIWFLNLLKYLTTVRIFINVLLCCYLEIF